MVRSTSPSIFKSLPTSGRVSTGSIKLLVSAWRFMNSLKRCSDQMAPFVGYRHLQGEAGGRTVLQRWLEAARLFFGRRRLAPEGIRVRPSESGESVRELLSRILWIGVRAPGQKDPSSSAASGPPAPASAPIASKAQPIARRRAAL
jgi:hypothetical protein